MFCGDVSVTVSGVGKVEVFFEKKNHNVHWTALGKPLSLNNNFNKTKAGEDNCASLHHALKKTVCYCYIQKLYPPFQTKASHKPPQLVNVTNI